MGGDQALFEFYASRVPADVTSGQSFWAWWRRSGHISTGGLVATPEELWGPSLLDVDVASFPDVWASAEAGPLPLRYEWVPGTDDDGVHVEVPFGPAGKVGRRTSRVAGAGPSRRAGGRPVAVATERTAPAPRPCGGARQGVRGQGGTR